MLRKGLTRTEAGRRDANVAVLLLVAAVAGEMSSPALKVLLVYQMLHEALYQPCPLLLIYP